MGAPFSEFSSKAQGPKPTSEGFSIDAEVFFGHKDLGEVAEVEIKIFGLDQLGYPVLQFWGKGMRGLSVSVSMEHAQGTLFPHTFFQPLNLAPGQTQHLSRLFCGHLFF